jgi:hypothetical protein
MSGQLDKSNFTMSLAFKSSVDGSDDSSGEAAQFQERGASEGPNFGGMVVGTIAEFNDARGLLVDHPLNFSGLAVRSRTVVAITSMDVGRKAVLLLEDSDPTLPIVVGLLQTATNAKAQVKCELDGERLVFTGSREIVLRCGGASITLTRAGKILIQGEYVATRSKGVNRIKGASVQIN